MFILGPGVTFGSSFLSENVAQQITYISTVQAHRTYFYNNYNGTEFNQTNTTIRVNGVVVGQIGHTIDRTGHTFGFSRSGTTPEIQGQLTGSTVDFTLP